MTTRLSRLLAIPCLSISLASCQKVAELIFTDTRIVTSGQFHGFVIGMSKSSALGRIKTLTADGITPYPDNADVFVSSRNIDEIDKLRNNTALLVRDNGHLWMLIKLKNGVISEIRLMPAPIGKGLKGISVGDSFERLKQTFIDTSKVDPALVIYPTLPDSLRFYALAELSNSNELVNYNVWHVEKHDGPAGAYYDLYFNGNRLVKIKYVRPRIRMDL